MATCELRCTEMDFISLLLPWCLIDAFAYSRYLRNICECLCWVQDNQHSFLCLPCHCTPTALSVCSLFYSCVQISCSFYTSNIWEENVPWNKLLEPSLRVLFLRSVSRVLPARTLEPSRRSALLTIRSFILLLSFLSFENFNYTYVRPFKGVPQFTGVLFIFLSFFSPCGLFPCLHFGLFPLFMSSNSWKYFFPPFSNLLLIPSI